MKEPFLDFIRNKLPDSFVLITCGLPVTGKSRVSGEVAGITGAPVLRSDLIRQEVLKDEDIFEEKVAADPAKRMMVYDEMFRRAEATLETEKRVILDATFFTRELRRRAAAIAAKHKLTFIIMETRCPEEVALRRLRGRSRENYESNLLTEAAYFDNQKRFESVDLKALKAAYPELTISHVVVDTGQDDAENWYITGIENS